MNAQTIRKLRDGDFDESALLSVAPVLGLDGRALSEIAHGEWRPNDIESLDGLAQFTTDYNGMAVNAYLVWDPASAWRQPSILELIPERWCALRSTTSWTCN